MTPGSTNTPSCAKYLNLKLWPASKIFPMKAPRDPISCLVAKIWRGLTAPKKANGVQGIGDASVAAYVKFFARSCPFNGFVGGLWVDMTKVLARLSNCGDPLKLTKPQYLYLPTLTLLSSSPSFSSIRFSPSSSFSPTFVSQ